MSNLSGFLGLDTSNYTTSSAIFSNGSIIQSKKLLPVKKGACGLRQSDAVFLHTGQLSVVIKQLFDTYQGNIDAVGVSSKPRNIQGSYMPCFTVGSNTAAVLSSVMKIPLYEFSHQQGHIMAALYSSNKLSLIKDKFLAFHVSGGTTDALLVTPDNENIIKVTQLATTLDLNAGQVVDRVGVMLGLDFPCGAQLEKLALQYDKNIRVKPTLKGNDCCLSGVENKCQKIFSDNHNSAETAAYALKYIESTISAMCENILKDNGDIPVVFSGGVMSDSIIRDNLTKKFGAYFAKPEFSCDNAAGIALLCAIKHGTLSI